MIRKRTRNQLTSTPMRMPKTRASWMDPPPNTTLDGRRSALLGQPLQRREPGVPVGRHARHPARRRLERLRAHAVDHLAAPPATLHEPGPVQDREVLDDGGPADR